MGVPLCDGSVGAPEGPGAEITHVGHCSVGRRHTRLCGDRGAASAGRSWSSQLPEPDSRGGCGRRGSDGGRSERRWEHLVRVRRDPPGRSLPRSHVGVRGVGDRRGRSDLSSAGHTALRVREQPARKSGVRAGGRGVDPSLGASASGQRLASFSSLRSLGFCTCC